MFQASFFFPDNTETLWWKNLIDFGSFYTRNQGIVKPMGTNNWDKIHAWDSNRKKQRGRRGKQNIMFIQTLLVKW